MQRRGDDSEEEEEEEDVPEEDKALEEDAEGFLVMKKPKLTLGDILSSFSELHTLTVSYRSSCISTKELLKVPRLSHPYIHPSICILQTFRLEKAAQNSITSSSMEFPTALLVGVVI